jgi:Uma2 family endonuclease
MVSSPQLPQLPQSPPPLFPLPPVAGDRLTFEQYQQFEQTREEPYELFRGVLVPMPQVSSIHIRICEYLIDQWRRFLTEQGSDYVVKNDMGVRTDVATSCTPDVTILSQDLWQTLQGRSGSAILDRGETPLWLAEVTSENWRNDYGRKRSEYWAIGVPEYWIVDPKRSRVSVLSNPDNLDGYDRAEFGLGETVRSVVFPAFSLSVDELFDPPVVEQLMQADHQARNGLIAERDALLTERDRLAAKLRELGVDPDAL